MNNSSNTIKEVNELVKHLRDGSFPGGYEDGFLIEHSTSLQPWIGDKYCVATHENQCPVWGLRFAGEDVVRPIFSIGDTEFEIRAYHEFVSLLLSVHRPCLADDEDYKDVSLFLETVKAFCPSSMIFLTDEYPVDCDISGIPF